MNRSFAYLSMAVVATALTASAVRTAESTSNGQGSALVRLQSTTPGVAQGGHANITGTIRAGTFAGSGSGLTGVPLDQVTQSGATLGQVVKWDGTKWAPGNDQTGLGSVIHDATLVGLGTGGSPLGVAVPLILTGSVAASGAIIEGRNTGTGMGLRGLHSTSGNQGFVGGLSYGVYGLHSATSNVGMLGLSSGGVYGQSGAREGYLATATEGAKGAFGANTAIGRLGTSAAGVEGKTSEATGWGVYGIQGALPAAGALEAGVAGVSSTHWGVFGVSDVQDGVFGSTGKFNTFAAGSGALKGGVHGRSALANTPDNFGVVGEGNGYGTGVLGVGVGHGHGVVGVAGNDEPDTCAGILGMTREAVTGVWPPMYGLNETTLKGMVAILGQSKDRVAIWGESLNRIGVIGTLGTTMTAAALPADNAGVIGRSTVGSSPGVLGLAAGGSAGVTGKFGPNLGHLGTSTAGVVGTGQAFGGIFNNLLGVTATVAGTGAAFTGAQPGGVSSATLASASYGGEFVADSTRYAVRALNTPGGNEVLLAGNIQGVNIAGTYEVSLMAGNGTPDKPAAYIYTSGGGGTTPALEVIGSNSEAAAFGGNVDIFGDLTASAKFFRIDHPLDPANKYLNHACVESNEMMNIYKGRVTLDANGEAWVRLPAWFESVNRDFEYHLTPIGAPGPNLFVEQEVKDGQFQIGGGKPGGTVSWQVLGTRHDPYAEAHPIKVEQEKPERDRGLYRHPELYGQSKDLQILAARAPRVTPTKGLRK